MTDAVVSEMTLYRVSGVIAGAKTSIEKALLIEKEIGNDSLYTMISMGTSLGQISEGLGITTYELEFILKRTPKHRKEYLNAMNFALAERSMPRLKEFGVKTYMTKMEAAAAKHHSGIVNNAAKILNLGGEDKGGSNITVNNTVVVRDENEVPTLPDGLEDVIEGEFENVDTES